ncbi:hypothetical protein [Sphingosinicella sp.]|uniref:hypothetical protein n=1 Tax=Sphingosinicella sp. TaxID=1917971 RepID=UPI0040381F73
MTPGRKLNRRSFLAAVIGGGAVAGGAAALVIGRSGAPIASGNGITDSDRGQIADAAANGRGTPRGYTDSDLAPVRDAQAAGRGPGARSRPAAAAGERAPAAASVRAPASSGCSDADVGVVADAGGRGRACASRRS